MVGSGIGIHHTLIVTRLDVGGQVAHLQVIGVSQSTTGINEVYGKLLGGGTLIIDNKLDRNGDVLSGNRDLHHAILGNIGLAVVLHRHVGTLDGQDGAVHAVDVKPRLFASGNLGGELQGATHLDGLRLGAQNAGKISLQTGRSSGGSTTAAVAVSGAVGTTVVAVAGIGNDIIQVGQVIGDGLIVLGAAVEGEHLFKGALLGDGAHMEDGDDAVTVDNHGGGIRLNVHQADPSGVCGYYRHGQTVGVTERLNGLGGVAVIGIHRQHQHVVLIQLVSRLQIGELHLTRLAGGIPEVQHQCVLLLQHLGGGVGVAVHIGDGEIQNGIAHFVLNVGGQRAVGGGGQSVQHDGILRRGQLIGILPLIAGVDALQHGVAAALLRHEGHFALGVGLGECDQIGQSLVVVDVYLSALNGGAGTVGDGNADGGTGSNGATRRLFAAGNQQQATQQDQQSHTRRDADNQPLFRGDSAQFFHNFHL